MQEDFRPDPRARARDHGLARLRRTTRISIFGATALAGAFAGVAAHSSPGHKARAAAAPAPRRRASKAAVPRPAPVTQATTTPAPVNDDQTSTVPASAPAPPPPPPPVTTSVQPVATTGTS